MVWSSLCNSSFLSILVERPNLGCRTLVHRHMIQISTPLIQELTDWQPKICVKAAALLPLLVLNAEEQLTQHAENFLLSMYKIANSKGDSVPSECRSNVCIPFGVFFEDPSRVEFMNTKGQTYRCLFVEDLSKSLEFFFCTHYSRPILQSSVSISGRGSQSKTPSEEGKFMI